MVLQGKQTKLKQKHQNFSTFQAIYGLSEGEREERRSL